MGGTKTQIQQIPQPPAPSAGETAADIAQARLEFDPQIAQQEFNLQQQFQPQQAGLDVALLEQFSPQIAQLLTDINKQQLPQAQELQQQLFPLQSQVTEALSQRALEQIESPFATTEAEETALGAIRQRQREQVQKNIRERANIGGGLFGGRAAGREEAALTELEQAFAAQDIDRRTQAGLSAAQAASPLLQILFPQVGTPTFQAQPFNFQSAVPSPDVLSQQIFNASRPETFVTPGAPNAAFGALGQLGGGLLSGAGAAGGFSKLFS